MTTQEKFLAKMRETAEDRDLQLIVDYGYANTGTVAFETEEEFDPVLSFSFNFQSGYCSFDRTDWGQRYPYVTFRPQEGKTSLDSFVGEITTQLDRLVTT
jgi:hypothetical protein